MNKKKVLATVLTVTAIIVVATIIIISAIVCSYKLKAKQEQEYIEVCISLISEDYSSFEKEENRELKIEKLKSLIEELEDYKQNEDFFSEVLEEYENKIKLMKDYFISDYDSEIAENTLENISEITDKEVLNNAKKSLENLLEIINSEYEITLNESEFNNYKETIDNLISSYNSRIIEIEKIEKEEAERLEAEKLAQKKKEENKKNNSNVKKDKNNSSKKENNSNSSVSNSNLEYVIIKGDKTGEIIFEGYVDFSHKKPGWEFYVYKWDNGDIFMGYRDGYGRVYDMEGNDITW